jgi:hypothetical protein
VKRFSDFSEEAGPLDGDKLKLDDILNQEITVVGYRIQNSRYSKNASGKYLTLQFELYSERHVVFTGSDVLISQTEKYHHEIPFITTIRKVNRYYTLS